MVLHSKGGLVFHTLPASEGLPNGWRWLPCPAQYPVDKVDMIETYGGTKTVRPEGKPAYTKTFQPSDVIKWERREGVRAKALYLSRRIGASYDEVLSVFEKVAYSPDNGHPFAARNKRLMAMGPVLERAGLPRPGTEAFGQMFRAVGSDEKSTCDRCKRCYSDLWLGQRHQAIAFRPDLSGGVVKTESLLSKVVEQRLAAAAAE
jgi:hypothetical protein